MTTQEAIVSKKKIHFTLINTLEQFDALSSEWNDLLAHSASHVPFLRHEYLRTWWQTLGGGEWQSGELFVLTARLPEGTLCGIAPFFATTNPAGEQALMLLGSFEISDYLDVIARPDVLPLFLEALFAYLTTLETPVWEVIDLYNILEDSPTLAALEQAAAKQGWSYGVERLQHCPYIPLPGDWDTYLLGIKKKQRHEIRRKMRRAAAYEQPVRWYIVDDESTLDAEIEAFLHLMSQDEEKQTFLTDVMRSQMRSAVRTAYEAGWLQLSFLEVDGKKAAGYLNFDFGGHIWVYNSGIDETYRSLSPGWVLLGHLLKWANEQERKAFDFMRGDEAYKYRFGGIDRFVVRVQIRR